MSEFFLEIFTEEMPPNLQISARENLLKNITNFLDQNQIIYDSNISAYSTPNRLIIYFRKIKNEVLIKSKEIKGPKTNSSDEAVEGFLKVKNISKKKLYKKKN